jgi:nitrogen fixation protein NifB
VQCNFCNRKFDCANESRPGVTTALLSPHEALEQVRRAESRVPHLAVVGIAGPGDPFANPTETLETLRLVKENFPEKLLCVSSNGLNIEEHIPALAEIGVSHVTITVNAVLPEIGAQIYEWIYFDKKTYYGKEGAQLLLRRQTAAIRKLKEHGITVKINTVVIPRVNTHHIEEIARYVATLGADLHNAIPLIPVAGTPFEDLREPSAEEIKHIRAQAAQHIPQMTHCARCRADAAGLLGKDIDLRMRPYIAVATTDGISVNQHLGRAYNLWIYEYTEGKLRRREARSIIKQQRSENRWAEIADTISDCAVLLVSAVGQQPLGELHKKGIAVEAVDGEIKPLLSTLFTTGRVPEENLRLAGFCSEGKKCS